MAEKFSDESVKKYERTGYKIVGKHSGIELCRWAKSRLRGQRNCYKSFYGIDSHRCMQMTPALDFCTFSCKFCWRTFGENRFKAGAEWNSPREIVDGIISSQKKLVSGFGGNPKTSKLAYKDAVTPRHVAISLDGEPTLYPYIAELIKEIHARGMSSFLVTNGTMPHILTKLISKKAFPDSLYLSVYATNQEDYEEIASPFIKNSFARVVKSLRLMEEFSGSRTVFRMTLVHGCNIKDAKGYAELIKISKPDFIEFKGYSFLGQSRKQLKISNMPKMEELEGFAEEFEKYTGYGAVLRDKVSRVIIFARDKEAIKWNHEKIREQRER